MINSNLKTSIKQSTYQNNPLRFINITMISHDLPHIIFCISIISRIFVSVLAALKEGTTVPFSFVFIDRTYEN